ncbi:MAG: EI24 domain-containing protein [Crocinitomicaceae bacterium]|nr:EI24 domain-containing protein [Crocinitomicaceae bacterium]
MEKTSKNFFQLIGLGFKNYGTGIKFLITHKLYWFAIFPLVLFLGVYFIGIYFLNLEKGIGEDIASLSTEVDSLNGIIWLTTKMIFFDALYMVFTKFTLYIVVILLSPLIAMLSEKIEEILTGNKYPFNLKQLINDVKRGIKIAARNLFWEYLFLVIILGVASFFGGSVKNILIFSLPLLIGFYFYGFAFIDYINERRRLNIQQSIHFVSKHRGLAIAIGSVYYICFLSFHGVYRKFDTLAIDTTTQLIWGSVLFITFLCAALAPILAITSATLSMHEVVDLSKNEFAIKTEKPKKIDQEEEEDSLEETSEPEEKDDLNE